MKFRLIFQVGVKNKEAQHVFAVFLIERKIESEKYLKSLLIKDKPRLPILNHS